MGSNPASVVVIGVNYKADAMALRFVRSVTAVRGPAQVALIIVDNTERAASDEFFAGIRDVNADVLCMKSPANLGYFGGAAFAYNQYLQTHDAPDWVIVSNVDIEFKQSEFFHRLGEIDYLKDGVGMVAPSIWSSSMRCDLNPRMVIRPSKWKMKFYTLLYRSYCATNFYILLAAVKYALKYVVKYKLQKSGGDPSAAPFMGGVPRVSSSASDSMPIYAPQGSCMIFSKLYFSRGGTLSYPSFLFGEEIFVAEVARKAAVQVLYSPQLQLSHDDHTATGRFRSRKMISFMHQTATFIADEYFA